MVSAVSTASYIVGAWEKLFSLFAWLLEGFVLTACKKKMLCTSQCKPRLPDPRNIAGDVTFLQCYISTFTPALGGIWTVTIPAPMAPVSKARRTLPSRGVWEHAPSPENFFDCFCWMRARLACLLSLLTHNVDTYLIYQKLYLFWEFTRVKIGVSNIKVTVGCVGRRLILKTFNLLWWRPPQCVPWRYW